MDRRTRLDCLDCGVASNHNISQDSADRLKDAGGISNRAQRNAYVERLRILAAYGVVTYHCNPIFSKNIGVISFLCFALIFGVFVVNKPTGSDYLKKIAKKANHLLPSWLFWSAIFFVFLIVKSVLKDIEITQLLSWNMVLIGTAIHLWFLPFAFMSAVLIMLTHHAARHLPVVLNVSVMFSIGLICAALFSVIGPLPKLSSPFLQWMLGFPAIPMGYAIGMSRFMKTKRHQYLFFIFSILSACVVACLIKVFGAESRFMFRYCIALGIVCFSLAFEGKMDAVTYTMSSLTFGIYLMHPLIISCFYFFVPLEKWPYGIFILVILTTTILTYLMKKSSLKKFV